MKNLLIVLLATFVTFKGLAQEDTVIESCLKYKFQIHD